MSIPGRLIPTYLADSMGHFNVVNASAFFTGITMLCLWLPFNFYPSKAGIIVFALVYGFVSGAFVSLLMPCIAKTGTLETIGLRFGTFQVVVGLSCLTGLPISGAILSSQPGEGYWEMQTFAILTSLGGFVFTLAATILLGRSSGTWRV